MKLCLLKTATITVIGTLKEQFPKQDRLVKYNLIISLINITLLRERSTDVPFHVTVRCVAN